MASDDCDAPIKSVVTELVDTKVWEWIIDITEHPHTIRKYLENAKETLEKHNAPLLARIAQIEESRRRIDRKVDGVLEMAVAQKDEARAQGNRKAVDEVNAMLQRFRSQLEQDLAELREEEDTLRSQLLSEVINDKFIGQWDKYASRIGDKIAEFDFKKRRDTLEALHFKGTLGVDNGERVVWVYLFESFADTIFLDKDVGNSVDNLPSLVTGDEPGRHYWS